MLILPDVCEVSGGMVWDLGRPAVLPAQREESVQKRLTRKGAWAGGARDAVPVIVGFICRVLLKAVSARFSA